LINYCMADIISLVSDTSARGLITGTIVIQANFVKYTFFGMRK